MTAPAPPPAKVPFVWHGTWDEFNAQVRERLQGTPVTACIGHPEPAPARPEAATPEATCGRQMPGEGSDLPCTAKPHPDTVPHSGVWPGTTATVSWWEPGHAPPASGQGSVTRPDGLAAERDAALRTVSRWQGENARLIAERAALAAERDRLAGELATTQAIARMLQGLAIEILNALDDAAFFAPATRAAWRRTAGLEAPDA